MTESIIPVCSDILRFSRGCVRKTRKRHAVREMMVGPSESLCRERFQTAVSCFGPMTAVVNVTEKARPMNRVMWGVGRRAQANLCVKHRKKSSDDIETGISSRFRDKSIAGTYLLAMRCPVQKRHDPTLGFRTELENLVGDAKGKGTNGNPVRPKVRMRRQGADCSVVAKNRGNSRGAKGAGHPRHDRVNGTPEELDVNDGRRQPSSDGTSRISREAYVRICERLGVKFPGPTRPGGIRASPA